MTSVGDALKNLGDGIWTWLWRTCGILTGKMDENVEVKKTVIQKRVFQTCGTFPGIVLAAGEAVPITTKPCYSQGKEPDSKWNNHKIQSTQIVRAGYMQQRRGVRQARAEFWTRRPEQAPRASRRPERRVWARLVDIFEEHSRRGKNKRKALVWEFAWRVPWGDAGEEGVR